MVSQVAELCHLVSKLKENPASETENPRAVEIGNENHGKNALHCCCYCCYRGEKMKKR